MAGYALPDASWCPFTLILTDAQASLPGLPKGLFRLHLAMYDIQTHAAKVGQGGRFTFPQFALSSSQPHIHGGAMKKLLVVLACAGVTAFAQTSQFFTIVNVADGVYGAIGKPGILSNAAIIVTDRGVIVVDTHLRPSWAKDLIQTIRQFTDKPVRYVINTHWHGDHVQGNQAYQAAFPIGTEFISHVNTREDVIGRAIPTIKQNLDSLPVQIGRLKARLESGKNPDGSSMTDSAKQVLRTQISSQESYLDELKTLQITIPNLTFDRSLILWAGDREIRLLYFGEGHTRGDIFIYLPKEKVLITGDMLTGGLPFMRDAVPLAWAGTLESVAKLDVEYIIPGHGDVQKGKERLNLVIQYLKDLYAAVRTQVEKNVSVEQAVKAVGDQLAPKYEKEFPNFRAGLGGPLGNVTKTYEAMKGK
jgi:glyoxylase-like metal-dependent hydrolase (beta-lactamase superfamily II)